MSSDERSIGIGELREDLGVTIALIRWWEQLGLVHPNRTDPRRRVFAPHSQARARFILSCVRAGLRLSETRELLDGLDDDALPSVETMERLRKAWRVDAQRREAAATRLIRSMSGDCPHDVPTHDD